jgi:two-component system, NtrC family, sensor kinase
MVPDEQSLRTETAPVSRDGDCRSETSQQFRKRMEDELRHAQKFEAIGRLAAGIAHELNTPIQFVGDNTRFLQEAFKALEKLLQEYREFCGAPASGADLSGLPQSMREAEEKQDADYHLTEIPKALEQTLEGVERLATIVRAMKDYAHPGQGKMAAADLNKAMATALVVARNEIKYVADVETDYGDLPPVVCNLEDLSQVFLNVLVNAAHAVSDAVQGTTRRGSIHVRTRSEGDRALISVQDTGTGIPEGIRARIFDPFFTTKGVGRGTGQGLAIARTIVADEHHGSLTLQTEMGQGTTFYISLPLHPPQARDARTDP